RPERHTTKVNDAESFLCEALADRDWHASAELKKVSDFNERMLQRAAKVLGIEFKSEGFPAQTFWRLPQSRQAPPTEDVATAETAQQNQNHGFEDPVATAAAHVAPGDATDATEQPNSDATAARDEGEPERTLVS